MIPDWRNAHLDVMDTRDDTASEPAAPAVARRDGPDWGHLPHGNLTNQIIGAGFEAHNVLGAGFLEAVYANALTVELRHRGVSVDRNVAFAVVYRGCSVGRYVADLVVDQKVNFRDQSGQSHPPGTPRTGVELPLDLSCVTLSFTTPRRFIPAHRMNHDHHDDADLFGGHPTISASKTVLWF